jgi:hypothetical protein
MDAAQIEAALAAMQQQMQQQQAAYNQQMIDMQSHHSQQMMAAAAAAAVAAATAAATAAAAAAAAPQPPQPLPPPPRGPAVRIAAPAEFDGRIGTLDAWQSLMRQQFDFFEYGPNADRERIRLCAVMLRGHALEWWQTRVNEPASWEAMMAALRTEFQPIDNAINARNKLLALKQGAGGAADYVSSFRRLMIAVPDMSESDRLFQFIRGLNHSLANHCRVQNVQSLAAAEALVVRVGAYASSSHAPYASHGTHHPTAMEIDALESVDQEYDDGADDDDTPVSRRELHQMVVNSMHQQSHPKPFRRDTSSSSTSDPSFTVTNRTPAQIKKHMAAGTCFQCGKKGHMSRQCPTKRSSQSN